MERKTRVLIVDDNLGMLETMADILDSYGFDADTAPDAPAAIEKFRAGAYDVAVVDIVLPGLNGVELVRRLMPEYPEARFIVITAYSESRLAREARELVGNVMFKPVEPARLVEAIKTVLGKSSGPAG